MLALCVTDPPDAVLEAAFRADRPEPTPTGRLHGSGASGAAPTLRLRRLHDSGAPGAAPHPATSPPPRQRRARAGRNGEQRGQLERMV